MPGEAGPNDLIRIGFVGKAHGVRGGFYVDGAIDPAALTRGFVLRIDDVDHTVSARGGTDARPIISLADVDDRNTAEALREKTIYAARASLTPLGQGEWYASDLEGMIVRDGAAADAPVLGMVAKIVNLPSVDVLEVASPEGAAPVQVPMVGDAIISIDPVARTIAIDARFLGFGA